jgi:hypothetical protein
MTAALMNLPGIQPFHVVRFSVNRQCGKVTVLMIINVTIKHWNRRMSRT